MAEFIDMIGKRFGSLTVVEQTEDQISESGRHRKMWICECDCGNRKAVNGDNLRGGKTLSCGCLQRQIASECNTKHGDADSRLYNIWCAIKRRCYKTYDPKYGRYGGRGIKMCAEWLCDYSAFMDWALKNGYRDDAKRGECTLDRINNDGDYTPDNCRWVTIKAQANNRSTNRHIKYKGETHTIAELAEMLDIPYERLYQRIYRYGYDLDTAITA